MTQFELGGGNEQAPDARLNTTSGGRPPRAELYLVVPDPTTWHARALAAGAT